MKALPKIVNCRCGYKASNFLDDEHSVHYAPRWAVECQRWRHGESDHQLSCWSGPERHSERGAINAWNKVMGVKQ